VSVDFIQRASFVFWDFDGVIKDSVEVKSDAFEQLFLPFGKDIAKKVRIHHEENGGISRFDKLPIYLDWAGQTLSAQLIDEYSGKFSLLVKQKVIDSKWMNGVLEYLQENYQRQQFFLVTATPQKEIEEILAQLKIAGYFKQVIGSPVSKVNALKLLLNKYEIDRKQAIMIGDSLHDFESAKDGRIPFALFMTKLNKDLQGSLNCTIIKKMG
jgi:phosphoglycolate phosphatase-like HAD superfamily hydrolase